MSFYGKQLVLAPRMDTENNMCLYETGLCALHMVIILDLLVMSIIGGPPIWPLDEHEKFHIDNG